MTSIGVQSSFGFKPAYSATSTLALAPNGVNAIDVTPATVSGVVTMTAAQATGGMVQHNVGGNLTTPTAAAIVAALPGCTVGTAFDCNVRAAGASTLVAGAGVTISALSTALTAAGSCKTWRFVVTNNLVGSEAVTVYSMGTAVM